MSTNIIMHKPEGLSSEIINDSFVRLLKYRVPTVAGGQVKFYCLAKDGTGLLDNIIHLPIRENADTNYGDESYDILQLLLEPILTNDDFTKNIIWNPSGISPSSIICFIASSNPIASSFISYT